MTGDTSTGRHTFSEERKQQAFSRKFFEEIHSSLSKALFINCSTPSPCFESAFHWYELNDLFHMIDDNDDKGGQKLDGLITKISRIKAYSFSKKKKKLSSRVKNRLNLKKLLTTTATNNFETARNYSSQYREVRRECFRSSYKCLHSTSDYHMPSVNYVLRGSGMREPFSKGSTENEFELL